MNARKLSTFSAFKSYQQITRVLFGVCVGLFMLSIILTCCLVALFPLKEIRPMMVSFSDKQNQVVRIEPLMRDVQGLNLMVEKLLMRYVDLRETIDGITESKRFQEVSNMTSPGLWDEFWGLMKTDNPKSPLRAFSTSRMTRSVHVERCLSLAATAPNTYRIEWVSVDSRQGQEVSRQNWITTIAVKFEEKEVRYEDQYINPLGLTVTHYTIAKKDIS